MMFVPNYQKDNKRVLLIFHNVLNDEAVYILPAKVDYHYGVMQKWREWRPIVIECPYCATSLQQNWRVECECGLVMEAISDMILDYFYRKFHNTLDDEHESPFIFYTGNDDNDVTRIHVINSINWLQISDGKVRE